jgi:tetratricopeptide (TPR) repeat protein
MMNCETEITREQRQERPLGVFNFHFYSMIAETTGVCCMKKIFAIIAVLIIVLVSSCATTDGNNETAAALNESVYEGEGVTLAEAIEQSAEKICADLPAKSRVAIVAWVSPSAGLSDYIMEELTGALVDRRMEVADRQNLNYVYRELDLQMSGDVSDESARSIGKFLGADLVITGQLTEMGGPYRYRANAVSVENATRDSVTRLDVRGDAALRRMIVALANQKVAIKTASYGESENAAPQTVGTFLDRGILFASRGDYAMAIEDFTEALMLDPQLSSVYMLRGRAWYASGAYVISVDENFNGITTTYITGQPPSSAQQQAYDQAITDYTQAIKLDPNNTVAYSERGRVYKAKWDYDKAIADYNQAIRLDPNSAKRYISRGGVYDDKGDKDRAIADYNQAIKLDPNYSNAYYARGRFYLITGDYDRAIADCTQAIRLDPDDASTYTIRGLAYENKNDYDRALADYTQAIRVDPNSAVAAMAYSNRGNIYEYKGDYDKAMADHNQSIRLDPNNANSYTSRGALYHNVKQDYDKAIADFEAALRINPNHTGARNNLELARRARGR